VRVSAELGVEAGVGAEREVVGHDRHRAAEEAEGRGGHAVKLDRDQAGHASADGFGEQVERVGVAQLWLPAGMLGAGDVFALGLAKGVTLASGEGCGHRPLANVHQGRTIDHGFARVRR